MRDKITVAIVSLVFVLMLSLAATAADNTYKRKIIVFDGDISEISQNILINRFGLKIKNLGMINGAVVVVPSENESALDKIPGVIYVEDDANVYAATKPNLVLSRQVLPWGVDEIEADLAWPLSTGNDVKVAVIDTGIDTNHPDLAANIKGGFNAIERKMSIEDDNGHGTQVAGTVAALNNDFGIIGAAPNTSLYAVKALDGNAQGRVSDVIDGIQWCVNNNMQVANMSFGSTSYSKALQSAVKKAYDSGLIMVAAAGNKGLGPTSTVDYPAKFNEVIAVSAIDAKDTVASWSSRGPEVDIAAPGVDINSTSLSSSYAISNGTSVAAPHIAGAIALGLQINPASTPQQIMDLLKATADPILGESIDAQGAGVVNAYKLVNVQ